MSSYKNIIDEVNEDVTPNESELHHEKGHQSNASHPKRPRKHSIGLDEDDLLRREQERLEQYYIEPLYEKHVHTSNGIKKSVVVDIYCEGKRYFTHELPAGRLEDAGYLRRTIGDRYTYNFCDKKEIFPSVRQRYLKKLNELPKITIRHIYEKIGFIDDSTVVLGNYLITAGEIKPVYIKGNDFLPTTMPSTSITEAKTYIEETMLQLTKERCTSCVWLCFKCLSFIAPLFEAMGVNCNLMLAVIGKTQVKKSSSVKAFFDPQNLPMLRMSFTDTRAAVQRGINNTGGLVAMLDDFAHKKGNGKEMQTLETVIRLAGDSQAGGKMVIGRDINGKTVTPFIVFTGEFLPHLQNSSLARIILTELDKNSVNTDHLTVMQLESERTVTVDAILAQAALNLPREERKRLANKFRCIRNELNNSKVMPQARFSDAAAWLLVAAEFLNSVFDGSIIDNIWFKQELCDLFNKQWSDHSDPNIMREYLINLYNIIELHVALCHFYLGLFLYKQPCFNEEEIYLHFSESQKQCCFASAPFISEFIEKYHSKYDCDIQAIWRARNGIEDDMEDNYNRFIFGGFDDEDLDEDDSFDFSDFDDDEDCDEISTVPTLPDRQNCLSSTAPRLQTEYSENHLDEYSNNMPFGINDNLDPEDDDEYEPFDSPDDHIYFDYEEDIDDYEECKPLIDWSVPHNGGSSEDFL